MSNDEKKEKATDENKDTCCQSENSTVQQEKSSSSPDEAQKTSIRKSHSGLTQQLGKPITESSDSVAQRNENIETSYQQLKNMKKFAMSGISTAFGDLLGTTTERARNVEDEKRAELAEKEAALEKAIREDSQNKEKKD